ncbi:acetate--CoA ligase family protein [Virgibacillus sp. YIM 98842]|uniref:ATP-binding protein n=1 Tax=Virgibacillus sp. YIM 98842 TaxID=2663533 RepID=UPI0013D97C6E|nr:acetate--CoA ligase family protein [Virgibacillus sp. YIM 98842]
MSILKVLKKKNKNTGKKPLSLRKQEEDAEFVRQRKKEGIGLKSSLIEYAAMKKGLSVDRISKRVIVVKSDKIERGFSLMNGDYSSRVGSILCTNKEDSRYLLKQKGLTVTESRLFKDSDFDEAVKYAEKIGYPVVVKPTTLSRGRGITPDIKQKESLQKAWTKAVNAYKKKSKNHKILVEKHFHGEDFRFYVVGDKLVSATHRKRASVTGDGKSSVLQLIKRKNNERQVNPYLVDHLIPEDYTLLEMLHEQKIDLDFIPKMNQEITLRKQSNIHAGGDNIDVTDSAHPEFKAIAIKAIQAIPGLAYGGVDIIAPDITIKPNEKNHIVSEVEFSPAPLAHFPYLGKKRNMAGAVIDYYFK